MIAPATPWARARLAALAALCACLSLSSCTDPVPVHVTAVDGHTIRVTMSERRFSVYEVDARVGQTVAFEFKNQSGVGHEAFIGTEDEQRRHAANRAAHADAARTVEVGSDDLGHLSYTFAAPGDYVVGCHVAAHYQDGMKFVVHVT